MWTGDEPEDADLDAPKVYEPVPTLDQLAEKLNSYMEQYNETVRGGKMDLVFFKVIVNLCKAASLKQMLYGYSFIIHVTWFFCHSDILKINEVQII
jgi:dynein heavy chain